MPRVDVGDVKRSADPQATGQFQDWHNSSRGEKIYSAEHGFSRCRLRTDECAGAI